MVVFILECADYHMVEVYATKTGAESARATAYTEEEGEMGYYSERFIYEVIVK